MLIGTVYLFNRKGINKMVTQTFTVKISSYADPRKQYKCYSGYELA